MRPAALEDTRGGPWEVNVDRPGFDALRMLRSGLFAGVILGCSWASPAAAFDDSRSGFLLEVGLGPGMAPSSRWTYSYPGGVRVESREEITGFAFNTRFRIGGGLSKQWALTYVNDISFGEDAPTGPGNWSLMANSLTGIAFTRYLKPKSPSFLLEAAGGLARVQALDGNEFSERGPGAQLAVGVETARHWVLRLSWGQAWYADIEDRSNVGMTLSWVWY